MSVESSIEDTTASIMSALSSHDLSDADKEEITKISRPVAGKDG